MSSKQEKDAVVDFLMTAAFMVLVLFVLRTRDRIDAEKRLAEKDQQRMEEVK